MSALGGSCAVALLLVTGAWAETGCAQPQDVTALKTADMQQFLMVAALTCNKIGRNAQLGDDDYNAYKTSLANAASLRSLHDPLFCQSAEAAYAAALGRPVVQLISEQPVPIKLVYTSCAPEGVQEAQAAPPVQRQASLSGR
jgi:hypothetical protein